LERELGKMSIPRQRDVPKKMWQSVSFRKTTAQSAHQDCAVFQKTTMPDSEIESGIVVILAIYRRTCFDP
jgi:hypothetical protein